MGTYRRVSDRILTPRLFAVVFTWIDEFAHCVMYLCSPLAGFVCGELIDLNGYVKLSHYH